MRRVTTHVLIAAAAVVLLSSCATDPVARSISAAMVSGSAGFTPATLRVDKGDKVRLRVQNRTDKQHGFTLEGYGIRRTVDPDKSITEQFTANRTGRFEIRCQLHPAHKPATLVVS